MNTETNADEKFETLLAELIDSLVVCAATNKKEDQLSFKLAQEALRAHFNACKAQKVEHLQAEIARLTAALELSGKANLALAEEIGEALVEDSGGLFPTAGSKRAICVALGGGIHALRRQQKQEPDFKDQHIIGLEMKELIALQDKYMPTEGDKWFYDRVPP